MTASNESSGIEDVIQRLRDQGVDEGQKQAQRIVDDARVRAEQLVEQAHQQAQETLRQAREEADRTRTAGEEAVRLAVRDAILSLKEELAEQFGNRVRRLVSSDLRDEKFLQRLVLEVARRSVPEEAGATEVLLPNDVVGLEELRRHPEEVREGTLSHFVHSLAGETLRAGVSFQSGEQDTPGIRVRLVDEDIEIDLTEKAIANLLLRHLLPRFRAIMEGIVQ